MLFRSLPLFLSLSWCVSLPFVSRTRCAAVAVCASAQRGAVSRELWKTGEVSRCAVRLRRNGFLKGTRRLVAPRSLLGRLWVGQDGSQHR